MLSAKSLVYLLLSLHITSAIAHNLPSFTRIFKRGDRPLLGDGIRGRYMREIGGPVRVSLNSTFVFVPASLIKTLIHAHALRRVQDDRDKLRARVKVYTDISGSCPLDSGGPLRLTLRQTLRDMMMFSDNRHTEALVKRYKKRKINNTAKRLGLRNTKLREKIGCFPAAQNMPSSMTLVDTAKLFQKVATRFLRGSTRKTFFNLMVDFNSHMEDIVDTFTSVNRNTRNEFKRLIFSRYKDGFYFYNSGVYYRSLGAYVRLPFRSCNGTITRKEYAVAAFVYKSLSKINFGVFVDWTADAMRDEIGKALMSFLPC